MSLNATAIAAVRWGRYRARWMGWSIWGASKALPWSQVRITMKVRWVLDGQDEKLDWFMTTSSRALGSMSVSSRPPLMAFKEQGASSE